MKTRYDRFALHFACRAKAPLDVTQYLVEQCPEALNVWDMDGMTPLAYAKKRWLKKEPKPDVVAWLTTAPTTAPNIVAENAR